ncbi:MAG: ACP S-malonyltransferase [Psychrobacter sp.]|nr:ACP S-malonyltransferase [Psychrobacter sp.]
MASSIDLTRQPRTAVIFPGQGSQAVGMLQELSEIYPQIQQTFAKASELLEVDLWAICQDESKLAMTEFTQPALLAASIAIWRILQPTFIDPESQSSSPTSFKLPKPLFLAGHSLGEYSALCAAGVIRFEDAIPLVYKRGQLMQQAVAETSTAMAAVLGLEDQCVVTLCERTCDLIEGAVVNAANFNSPGQVVISGNKLGVDNVIENVQTTGKKAIPLKVSVPSHCALMQSASAALAQELEKITFFEPTIPVIQNRNARAETDTAAIKQALIEQLSEPVLWSQTMNILADKQIALLIECGSGNVLSNLAKRQAQPIISYPTDKPMRLDKLFKELS